MVFNLEVETSKEVELRVQNNIQTNEQLSFIPSIEPLDSTYEELPLGSSLEYSKPIDIFLDTPHLVNMDSISDVRCAPPLEPTRRWKVSGNSFGSLSLPHLVDLVYVTPKDQCLLGPL